MATVLNFNVNSQFSSTGIAEAQAALAAFDAEQQRQNRARATTAAQRARLDAQEEADRQSAIRRGMSDELGIRESAWQQELTRRARALEAQRKQEADARQKDHDDFIRSMNDMRDAGAAGAFSMMKIFAGLGPALLPVVAVAGAVTASITTTAVAAGAAAGIFGGALVGAIASVESATHKATTNLATQKTVLDGLTPGTAAYEAQLKKVNAAQAALNQTLAGLDPVQRQFITSQTAMKDAWAGFIKSTQADTLGPVAVVMQAVAANMSKLVPVVHAVAPLFMDLAKAMAAWMNGPQLQKYIDLIIKYGVPALRDLMTAGRAVAAVLGQGFQDFLPNGQKFFDMLATGATKMKDWATGGGFKDFLSYAKNNAPDVKKLLADLVTILDHVAGSIKDTSGPALKVTEILASFVALVPPSLIDALTYAWIAWGLAMQAWAVYTTVAAGATTVYTTALTALAAAQTLTAVTAVYWLMVAGLILLVVVAVAALAFGIYELIKHWDTVWGAIKTAWFATWDAIKKSALYVWNFLTTGWGQFVLLLLGPVGVLIFLAAHWQQIWDSIRQAAVVVWDALKKAWSDFSGWFTDKWDKLWPHIMVAWHAFIDPVLKSWHTVWPEMKQAGENIWNALVVAWDAVWGFFTKAWEVFWSIFGPTFKRNWDMISSVASTAWGVLTAVWSAVWTTIVSIAQVYWSFISGVFQVWLSVMTGIAQVAWAILSGAWQVLWAVIQGIFSVFAAVFGAIFWALWNVIVTIATGLWNVLVAAWQALWAVITAIFMVLFAIFTGHWGAAWNSIYAAAMAIWNLIQVAFQSFVNIIISIVMVFVDAIVAGWNAMVAAVENIVTVFVAAVINAWNVFINAVITAWDTLWNAVASFIAVTVNSIMATLTAWIALFVLAYQTFLAAVQLAWDTAWTWVKDQFQKAVDNIKLAWDTFTGIFTTGYNAFLDAVKLAWDVAWQWVKDKFTETTNSVVTAAGTFWDNLKAPFVAGAGWLTDSFWPPVQNFFTKTIPDAFSAAVAAVGKGWDLLKDIVRKPIQAIVDVVYNNGIVKLWNLVAHVFSAPTLDEFTLHGFARGGPVNGPGTGTSDSIHARLSAGEHVWTAREVKNAGGHAAVAELRSQAMGGAPVRVYGNGPRFDSGGGIFGTGWGPDFGPDLIPDGIIGDALGALKSAVMGAISGPFNSATDLLLKGAIEGIKAMVPGSDTPMEKLGIGISTKVVRTAQSWVAGHDIAPTSGNAATTTALAWARTQMGMPYQWGGDGNPSWDCSGFMSAIESVIRGEKPHRRWATGAFSGSVAPNGWMLNEKSPFMIGITNAGVGHTAGTLNGTNVECSGGVGVRVGGNARGYNDGMFTDRYGFTPAIAVAATSGDAQATAKAMLAQFGWGDDQWPPLQALWQRESGWSVSANNPASGAFGIPQSLPASKMASAGADYLTNAATQIKWGLGYIKERYGSPAAADAFQRANNWYAKGTYSAFPGWAAIGERGPELMKMRGGEQVTPLGDLAGGGDVTVAVTIPVTIQGNATPETIDKLHAELVPRLRMALEQGVGRRP